MKLVLISACIVVALYAGSHWLDGIQQQAYQAAVVRCATGQQMLGCEKYETAAGPQTAGEQ